jgi:hypothetical protein
MSRSKTMAHRTLGTRAVIAGLCASVLAGGCAATVPSLYTGTGSLAVSGSPNQPVLASHSVFFGECPSERQPANNREVEPFSIVVVVDACVMGGTGGPSAFHPDPGTVCTLRFLDGVHRVRVTDFAARLSLKPWGTQGMSRWRSVATTRQRRSTCSIGLRAARRTPSNRGSRAMRSEPSTSRRHRALCVSSWTASSDQDHVSLFEFEAAN